MADVLVLCYHAVSQRWDAELSITPDALRTQLRTLVERGYRGATFSDAVADAPWPKTLAVTFDDGFRSVLELGFPVLEELGLPGTVFVVTDFVGSDEPMSWDGIERWRTGEHERELRSLSWDDARALVAAGWEIGSHTCSHPRLTGLPDAALAYELSESRKRCEDGLGRPCLTLAYPYGDHDARVVEAAAAAGYRFACTLPDSFSRATALTWPRVGVYYADTAASFRAKTSPTIRRMRAAGLSSVLRVGRRLLFR